MALVGYGYAPLIGRAARLAIRNRRYIRQGARIVADYLDRARGWQVDRRFRARVRQNQVQRHGAGGDWEEPATVERPRKIRRVEEMAAVGGEGGYVNDVHYKRKRKLGSVTVRKIAKTGTKSLYDRWQKMGLYGNDNGSLWLSRSITPVAEDGTTALAWRGCPYYLFDLTAIRNYVDGVEHVPEMAWNLLSQGGNFAWNHIRGNNIGNGANAGYPTNSRYQYYDTPRNSGGLDAAYDKCILDWVKIQAIFWGSKKQSHKIFVDLIQSDEIIQPMTVGPGTSAPIGTSTLKSTITAMNYDDEGDIHQANIWYTNQIATLCDSPFATWAKQFRNPNLKILDRKVIEFSPVASYEEGGTPVVHKKSLNFFVRMGRKLNFSWDNASPDGGTTLTSAGIETNIERGMHSCYVNPKAKVFLRIMAQNWKDGETSDYAPSFDLRISRKLIVDG